MIKMSKRFTDRAKAKLRRFQNILQSARARDLGESDTALIVSDIISEILGYDKYEEVTTEFAIRSQWCDLAVKIGGQVRYLIEVKPIGTTLRENHLNQAIAYGARHGVEWVILTNGVIWQAHRLRFEQPIQSDQVFTIDLLDPDAKTSQCLEKLYLISKEASAGGQIDQYWRHKEATNRYVIGQLLLQDSMLAPLRRQLRALFPGLKTTEKELRELLETEVLKRDVLEGDKAEAARRVAKNSARRIAAAAKREQEEERTVTAAQSSKRGTAVDPDDDEEESQRSATSNATVTSLTSRDR